MARTVATKRLTQPTGPVSFTLPHAFVPRSYEREVFAAYERGVRRFVLCWHRRSGKDRTCLALTTVAMAERPGLYLHVYPTNELARKAMWIAAGKEGRPFLDAFPPAWIEGEPNKTELLIRVKALPGQPAGSIWKLAGADDPDSLRGLNPVGVVLSEYSEDDPRVWEEVISPILNENEGWVIFNFTPKGKNHAHDIYRTALQHPERWFVSRKTVDETRRDAPGENGRPVVEPTVIAQEREEGRPEEIIQQESYCSFDGFLRGTIYGDCLQRARADGRITRVPYEVSLPVGCCLDIGRSDGTAIWFYQVAAREIRVIDYLAVRGKGAHDVIHALKNLKPYLYGRMTLPNDAQIKGFSATQSTREVFDDHFSDVVLLDKIPVQQGIAMLRMVFPRLVFDEAKCSLPQDSGRMPSGMDSLGNYRYGWDDTKQENSLEPIHDQFCHGADALRYGAMEGFTPLDWLSDDAMVATPTVMKFNVFSYGRT